MVTVLSRPITLLIGHERKSNKFHTKREKQANWKRRFHKSNLDMGRITADIKVKESMLEEAKRLVSEKKVFLEEVIIGYCRFMHGTEMAGEARGSYIQDQSFRTITCMFSRNAILQVNCEVSGCYHSYRGYYSASRLCVHTLALLLLTEEYLQKYNPGDTTDSAGQSLLGSFRTKQGLKFLEEQENEIFDLKLEPMLEKEEIKQRISLYGERLDNFYDLLKDCLVSCTDKTGRKAAKTSYLLCDGKPRFSLKIEKDVDGNIFFMESEYQEKHPS